MEMLDAKASANRPADRCIYEPNDVPGWPVRSHNHISKRALHFTGELSLENGGSICVLSKPILEPARLLFRAACDNPHAPEMPLETRLYEKGDFDRVGPQAFQLLEDDGVH